MTEDAAPVHPRVLSADVLGEELVPDAGSEALSPALGVLTRHGPAEIGVWEAGPGTDTDVEVEEVFLVLRGAGTVTFDDGTSVELRPGVVVRLQEGDHTRWDITERLRKLYIS